MQQQPEGATITEVVEATGGMPRQLVELGDPRRRALLQLRPIGSGRSLLFVTKPPH